MVQSERRWQKNCETHKYSSGEIDIKLFLWGGESNMMFSEHNPGSNINYLYYFQQYSGNICGVGDCIQVCFMQGICLTCYALSLSSKSNCKRNSLVNLSLSLLFSKKLLTILKYNVIIILIIFIPLILTSRDHVLWICLVKFKKKSFDEFTIYEINSKKEVHKQEQWVADRNKNEEAMSE